MRRRARSPCGELSQERVRLTFALERRQPHVPWVDGRLPREALKERADRGEQRRPVAPRQVDPADRTLEQDVPGEQRMLGRRGIRQVTRAVAWSEQDLELDPGQRQGLAAGQQVIGLVALERAEARPWHEVHDV